MREDITDEDINRLNDVRKRIWKGGYAGFLLGGVWGLGNCVLYKVVQSKAVEYFPEHPVIKTMPRLQNKHLVMWSLVAGATGMFIGAGMQGMRGNESLRDIYERKTSDNNKDEHQEMMRRIRHRPDAPEYHVAKASAESHSRREDAIRAKRQQDEAERDGTSKSGAFKPW
eukprot:jgi/Undpi1/8852/HiC_scaffold_25.g11314.m1